MIVGKRQMMSVELLREAEWNANRVPKTTLAKIRRSIERYGFVENLVVRAHPDEPEAYEVLSGNHRLQILREIGVPAVPVVVVDADDAYARLLAQALNRTRGRDDPLAYRNLIETAVDQLGIEDVVAVLPETTTSIEDLLGRLQVRHVDVPEVWAVIVECKTADEQNTLLERFVGEGRDARPLMA